MQKNIFTLPDLGENIEGGDIVSLSIKAGDNVSENDIVCEIETDKATVEVPSSLAGKVGEVFVGEGENVKVGQNIFSLVEQATEARPVGETPAKTAEQPPPPETPQQAAQKESAANLSESVVEVCVPDLGGGDNDAATVLSVLIKEGENIGKDDIVLEAETDKATVEVPCDQSGKIEKVHVKEGDSIKKGDLLLTLKGQAPAAISEKPVAAPPKTVPSVAESPKPVSSKETPLVRPSSKQTPSPTLPSPLAANAKKTAAFFDLVSEKRLAVPASPHTRRFAREIGIPIEDVPGTGLRGRISIDDVKSYSKTLHEKNRSRPVPSAGSVQATAPPLPDFAQWGPIESENMNKIKQVTSSHMSNCWAQIPHVTQFDKADIDFLERLRKKHKLTAEAAGAKLTMTAIVLKACAAALKKFPRFNSSLDSDNNQVILKKYIHIGVAVDTPNGLIVPVIRDVDQKNILQLAADLGEISKKARDRKIAPADLQGGTFTLSNLGGIGGAAFTPIVNWPQVSILGVSKSVVEPVFTGGEFQPRLMMPLSLSYDHRVIDGADGARFLKTLIGYLEDPFLLNLTG